MKENFLSNSINKIKKGAIIGSIAVASFSPMKSVSAENSSSDHHKNKTEIIKENIENMTMETMNFKDFNPTPGKKLIEIFKDGKLNAYVTGNCSIDEIHYDNGHINESKSAGIENFEEFKKEILKVALDLGYSEDNVKNLSIHDAIMLSGNILAKKITYDFGMIEKENNVDSVSDPKEKVLNSFKDAFSGADRRNEEAKKIDKMSCDEIFREGKGICRNYAAVNKAVFEVIKKMNNNLKNVYMKWYSPSSLAEMMALPHAWNQVINVSEEENKIKLLVTYVDPTWLDTRKTTVDGSGVKVNMNDEDIYNAFDPNHFFEGCLSAHIEVAKLYETLGSSQREYYAGFNRFDSKESDFIKEEVRDSYLDLAYNQRIKICKVALDSAKIVAPDNLHVKDILFTEFKISMMEAIANANEDAIGNSSILGPVFNDYGYLSKNFTQDKLTEIKDILLQGEKIFSLNEEQEIEMKFIDGENMSKTKIPFFSISKKLDQIFNK